MSNEARVGVAHRDMHVFMIRGDYHLFSLNHLDLGYLGYLVILNS
jgi:hypothetical protein